MVHFKFSMKCVVLGLNTIFAAAGLALLVVGTVVQLQTSTALDMIDGVFRVTPLFSIVIGAVMFSSALLGCGGACLKNRMMLSTYTFLLGLQIIGEVTLAVLIFVSAPKFEPELLKALDDIFLEENKETFHALEAALRCCGNRGPSSYGAQPIPPSCCPSHYVSSCTLEGAYQSGCNDLIVNWLYGFASIVGSITIAAVALKVSLCLLPLTVKEEKVRSIEENSTEESDKNIIENKHDPHTEREHIYID